MENMSHEDFVKKYKLSEIKVLFDEDKFESVLFDILPDGEVKVKYSKFKALAQAKYKALAILSAILLLISPLKLLAVLAVMYFALLYGYKKYTKKYILDEVLRKEEFFAKMVEKKVIHVVC